MRAQLEHLVQQMQGLQGQLQQSEQERQRLAHELQARHEHLDGRINRSRAREEELEQAARVGRFEAFPPGMKVPKLLDIDAQNDRMLRQWFKKLRAYLKAFNLSEEDPRAVFYASQHFKGALQTWWQGLVDISEDPINAGISSVSELAKAACSQFCGRDIEDSARDRLRNARQTGSVRQYANYLRENLLYLPDRPDADNLHAFKAGLKPGLAEALALRKPTSFAQAIEIALEVEAAQLAARGGARPRRDDKSAELNYVDGDDLYYDSDDLPAEGEEAASDDEDGEAELNNVGGNRKLTRSEREKLMREGRCFRCTEKGHNSRECPRRKTRSAGDR